jgi:hypothetical protein
MDELQQLNGRESRDSLNANVSPCLSLLQILANLNTFWYANKANIMLEMLKFFLDISKI